ncbi:hypothetical protein IKQ21_01190 [bacterium]|nr:hypothetical protein [bacterium]
MPVTNSTDSVYVSIPTKLSKMLGSDGQVSSKKEAQEVHEYYLSLLGTKLNSYERECIVLANRSAEEFLRYGRKENFWTLIDDAVKYGKKLYAKYFKPEYNKELAKK